MYFDPPDDRVGPSPYSPFFSCFLNDLTTGFVTGHTPPLPEEDSPPPFPGPPLFHGIFSPDLCQENTNLPTPALRSLSALTRTRSASHVSNFALFFLCASPIPRFSREKYIISTSPVLLRSDSGLFFSRNVKFDPYSRVSSRRWLPKSGRCSLLFSFRSYSFRCLCSIPLRVLF